MKTWIPLLGVALATATASACLRETKAEAATSRSAPPPTVAVVTIGRGDVAQVLSVAAEFRPFREIDVHTKVAGYLRTITVDVGDRVRAGQLLGTLEVPELQDELLQGEAAAKRAQHEVVRAQAEIQRAESAHQMAHLAAERLNTVLERTPNLVARQDVDEAVARDEI